MRRWLPAALLCTIPGIGLAQTASVPVQGYRVDPVFIWQRQPGGSFTRTSATLEGDHLPPAALRIISDASQSYVEVANGGARYWVASGDLVLPATVNGTVCSDLISQEPGNDAVTSGIAQDCDVRQ